MGGGYPHFSAKKKSVKIGPQTVFLFQRQALLPVENPRKRLLLKVLLRSRYF